MKKNIITISRQFGSGGRSIGKMLSEKLEIPFYDKELIELASKESGIDERIFKSEGEETGRFYQVLGAIGFALGSPAGGIYEYSINDELFLAQSSIIEQVAEKGPCILIGRCADYVLRNRKDLVRIFIMADKDFRIKTLMKRKGIDAAEAKKLMRQVDKDRSSYYKYYTDQIWGEAENYDLCVDSSRIGIQGSVEVIKAYIAAIEKARA